MTPAELLDNMLSPQLEVLFSWPSRKLCTAAYIYQSFWDAPPKSILIVGRFLSHSVWTTETTYRQLYSKRHNVIIIDACDFFKWKSVSYDWGHHFSDSTAHSHKHEIKTTFADWLPFGFPLQSMNLGSFGQHYTVVSVLSELVSDACSSLHPGTMQHGAEACITAALSSLSGLIWITRWSLLRCQPQWQPPVFDTFGGRHGCCPLAPVRSSQHDQVAVSI